MEEQSRSIKINLNKSWRKKSDFCLAPSTNPNAAAFLKQVNNDLEKLKRYTKCPTNLNDKEALALKQLSDNNQITIKPTDKGSNIVLLDNEKYINMCNKILKNQDWYRCIPADIVEKYNKDLYVLVDTAYLNNTITKNQWDFIRNNFPRIPHLLCTPEKSQRCNKPTRKTYYFGDGRN